MWANNKAQPCQTTRILPDEMAVGLLAASHFVPGAARGGAQKQASRLRAVRDLCCGVAEHPRSYGTAGSATGKICCALKVPGRDVFIEQKCRNWPSA